MPRIGDTRTNADGSKSVYTANGWAPQTSNKNAASNTYRLGAFPVLNQGKDLSSDSATGVYNKLLSGYGVQTVLDLANQMTNGSIGNNIDAAKKYLTDKISTMGAAQGGVFGALQSGVDFTSGSPNGGGGGGAVYTGPSASQISALDTVKTALWQYGLDNLSDWATNRIMSSDNVPAAQILMDMRQTPEYQQRFPGMAARAANGLPPITENEYINLEQAYSKTARNYQLPEGFMTPQEQAILIGHDVSAEEFQDRVINGYNVAMSAPKETRQLLKDYYGLHQGDLAAYYLDPTRAKNIWQKQTQSAVAGTEAMASGFGRIGKNVAGQIAAQTIGTPSNMNADYYRSQFAKIAPLRPLETAQVGLQGQGTVSKKQLIGTAFAGAVKGVNPQEGEQAIVKAEQARTAGLSGGGGYAAGPKGVAGAGSGTTEGVQ